MKAKLFTNSKEIGTFSGKNLLDLLNNYAETKGYKNYFSLVDAIPKNINNKCIIEIKEISQ